jgi:hypothetical protein
MQGQDELRERRCCICGRRFVPASQHVLHRGTKWCCKPTCFLKLLDRLEENKHKRRKKSDEQNKNVD